MAILKYNSICGYKIPTYKNIPICVKFLLKLSHVFLKYVIFFISNNLNITSIYTNIISIEMTSAFKNVLRHNFE